MRPDFNVAISAHLAAISNRDIEAFKAHMTTGDKLYTIVQNGFAFTTPQQIIDIHQQWFADPNWIWEGKIIHTVEGEDMAMALIQYEYRPHAEDEAISTWLVYVFKLEEGAWRIVHDQNTALDFPAFARANNMDI